jgi:hypothetical protein
MANPLFRFDCLKDGDTSTGNQPQGGTFILFDLHKGHPNPISYEITHVRLYGSTTGYTWDVYVGNDASGCTGDWSLPAAHSAWTVGNGWYEAILGAPTSGRYIKLLATNAGADGISENTVFEFQYKSTETGADWQTPVMVVYECTDIAEHNYQLLPGSPVILTGDCDGSPCDMGAYGGAYPIVDSEIP